MATAVGGFLAKVILAETFKYVLLRTIIIDPRVHELQRAFTSPRRAARG